MNSDLREPQIETEKNGWEDETAKRAASVNAFIVQNFFSRGDSGTKYDSLTELHLSGGGWDGLQKVAKGEDVPSKVNTLYQGGKITQIHVLYECEKEGDNDFYLTGKALEDYLSGE